MKNFDISYNLFEALNPLEVMKEGSTASVKAIPVFEIFSNPEKGFRIYACETSDGGKFQVSGSFPTELTIGKTYLFKGKVSVYRFEKQLTLKDVELSQPTGRKATVSYLQTLSGLKKRAEDIYDVFGDDSLEILLKTPMEVSRRIKGIGKSKVMSWSNQLLLNKHEEEDLLYLFKLGLTPSQVEKLKKHYGSDVRTVIEDNPYRLIHDVNGYGFVKCDKIALESGIPFDSEKRVTAGILHLLQEAVQQGHMYQPKDVLVENSQKVLNNSNSTGTTIESAFVESCIQNLIDSGEVKDDNEDYFLTSKYFEELKIAKHLKRINENKEWKKPIDIERTLDAYLERNGFELEERQREAVVRFCKNESGFHILRGSAGCGKTFTLKIILDMLHLIYKANRLEFKVGIVAPTGRASKVASKSTGRKAKTIHRFLGTLPTGGFMKNEDNPVEEKIIVVDESSMLDSSLTADLLSAVSKGAKVIFLGDTKQLPSVGAGNVLSDMIISGVVDVVTLNVPKRQGEDSGIIDNADRIINGEMIKTQTETNDSFVIFREDSQSIQKTLLDSIKRLLDLGKDFEEIQVLTFQRKGSLGIYNLNRLIQKTFNPVAPKDIKIKNRQLPKEEAPLYFHVGDKVLHTKNELDKELYDKENGSYVPQNALGITNGESGVIEEIVRYSYYSKEKAKVISGNRIIVRYEDAYVFYDTDAEVEMLDHAYAMTTHKSQGSQWDNVLIPVSREQYHMLENNLIYTACTRAKKFNAVIGQKSAIEMAIKTHRSNKRYTKLDVRLSESA